ncbi:MAG: FlgK family flagellar hook-associated protein [Butyricicoccus sp.]
MISTFGSFSMAKLGIRSSQQGLQITGNNITNINTNGYTRQRINQISLYHGTADRYSVSTDVRMGIGSLVTSVSQIRDPFLDIRYRNEASNVGFYDEKLANLEELQAVLDEVSKDGIHTNIEEIRTQLQNLANNPTSKEHDTLVRSACQKLVSLLNKYSADLKTQKENALQGFDQNVDGVNKILSQIRDLNIEIRKSQIHGDPALEMIDNRNLLIDQLSEMTKIKVSYSKEQVSAGIFVDKLTIEMDAPGQDPANRPILVDGSFANKLEISPLGQDGKPDATAEDYKISLGGLTNTKGESPLLAEIKEQMENLNSLTNSMQGVNKQLADVNKQLTDWKNAIGANGTGFVENDFGADRDKKLKELQDAVEAARKALAQKPGDAAGIQKLKDAQNKLDTFHKLDKQKQSLDRQKTELEKQFNNQFNALNEKLTAQGLTAQKQQNADGTFNVTMTGGNPAVTPNTLIDGNNPTTKPQQFSAEMTQTGEIEVKFNGNKFATKDKDAVDNAAHKNDKLAEKDWYGVLKADLEYLNGKGEFGTPASKIRGIAYYQRSLDSLAQTLAKTMNDINRPLDLNPDGTPKIDPATGKPLRKEANLFESNDPNNKNITASNISISKGWLDGSIKITTSVDPAGGKGDNSNVLNMIQGLNKDHDFVALDKDGNPIQDNGQDRKFFTGSFEGMFTNMNAILGADMSATNTLLNNYSIAANERAVARDNVSTVDLNEEGINLVQYQKSFAAACRVMTTLDEMLDSVLSIKR